MHGLSFLQNLGGNKQETTLSEDGVLEGPIVWTHGDVVRERVVIHLDAMKRNRDFYDHYDRAVAMLETDPDDLRRIFPGKDEETGDLGDECWIYHTVEEDT